MQQPVTTDRFQRPIDSLDIHRLHALISAAFAIGITDSDDPAIDAMLVTRKTDGDFTATNEGDTKLAALFTPVAGVQVIGYTGPYNLGVSALATKASDAVGETNGSINAWFKANGPTTYMFITSEGMPVNLNTKLNIGRVIDVDMGLDGDDVTYAIVGTTDDGQYIYSQVDGALNVKLQRTLDTEPQTVATNRDGTVVSITDVNGNLLLDFDREGTLDAYGTGVRAAVIDGQGQLYIDYDDGRTSEVNIGAGGEDVGQAFETQAQITTKPNGATFLGTTYGDGNQAYAVFEATGPTGTTWNMTALAAAS